MLKNYPKQTAKTQTATRDSAGQNSCDNVGYSSLIYILASLVR